MVDEWLVVDDCFMEVSDIYLVGPPSYKSVYKPFNMLVRSITTGTYPSCKPISSPNFHGSLVPLALSLALPPVVPLVVPDLVASNHTLLSHGISVGAASDAKLGAKAMGEASWWWLASWILNDINHE